MRGTAFLCLALGVSGCGYKTWYNPPFSGGSNPNAPVGDSENLMRAMGQEPAVSRLTTEPGDIWPGPLAPAPTLKDLVSGGLTPQPERGRAVSPVLTACAMRWSRTVYARAR